MNLFKLFSLVFAMSFLTACGVDDAMLMEGEDGAVEAMTAQELETAKVGAKFETFRGQDDRYYFHLKAGNGEIVLRSQGYSTSSGARSGTNSVKTNGSTDARYFVREASNGDHYFVLIAGNGRIIAMSEMYASKYNAERAVTTVAGLVASTVELAPAPLDDPRFTVFKGLDGKHYFNLRAANGQIVLQSQGYTSKSGASNGIASVISNGVNEARFEVLPAADGNFYFRLKASNGRVMGRGETYASKFNAERGAAAVRTILAGPVAK